MKRTGTIHCTLATILAVVLLGFPAERASAENVLDPDGWPRTFDISGTEIAIYTWA